MAVDYPLVLHDCHFEGLSWQQENEEVNHVLSALQQHWTQSAVKARILHGMIQGLEATGNCSLLHFTLKLNIITDQAYCNGFVDFIFFLFRPITCFVLSHKYMISVLMPILLSYIY